MKSYRHELWFSTPGRRAFVNITPQVEDCLRESGVCEGLCLVNAMHITASVFINDDIIVKVLGIHGEQVKIGIDAPRGVPVHRKEVHERIWGQEVAVSVCEKTEGEGG